MNLIDIVALIAMGYGAYRGFRNGVIIEVTGLIGLIIGVWAGLRLAFIFANYYRDNFDIPENYIPLLAFFTAFLLGIGLVYFIGRATSSLVNSVGIGLPNKLGGLVFGAAKWAFIAGTGLSLLANSQMIPPDSQESSVAYQPLNVYCTTVQQYSIGLIPAASNVFDDVETYFVDLDSTRRAKEGLPPSERPNPDSVSLNNPF